MLQAGMHVVVHDPDLKDVYTAVVVSVSATGANPLVRIKTIVRYPLQHAIAWPDVANENAPLREGDVCRLPVIKIQGADTGQTYAESLKAALMIARCNARHDGRRDIDRILALHEIGVFSKKRALLKI